MQYSVTGIPELTTNLVGYCRRLGASSLSGFSKLVVNDGCDLRVDFFSDGVRGHDFSSCRSGSWARREA